MNPYRTYMMQMSQNNSFGMVNGGIGLSVGATGRLPVSTDVSPLNSVIPQVQIPLLEMNAHIRMEVSLDTFKALILQYRPVYVGAAGRPLHQRTREHPPSLRCHPLIYAKVESMKSAENQALAVDPIRNILRHSGIPPKKPGVVYAFMPHSFAQQFNGLQQQMGSFPQFNGSQQQMGSFPQFNGSQQQLGSFPQFNGLQQQMGSFSQFNGSQQQLGSFPQFNGLQQQLGSFPQFNCPQQLFSSGPPFN